VRTPLYAASAVVSYGSYLVGFALVARDSGVFGTIVQVCVSVRCPRACALSFVSVSRGGGEGWGKGARVLAFRLPSLLRILSPTPPPYLYPMSDHQVVISASVSAVWLIPGVDPDPQATPLWSVLPALALAMCGTAAFKYWELGAAAAAAALPQKPAPLGLGPVPDTMHALPVASGWWRSGRSSTATSARGPEGGLGGLGLEAMGGGGSDAEGTAPLLGIN
jgi:hypothetical protein